MSKVLTQAETHAETEQRITAPQTMGLSVLARSLGWPLLAGGLPFVVYLLTLAPTVYGLDSAEFSTGAYVLGIVHSPGSPFYLLLGHLFTYLPVGDVGYRLNLMSAVISAVSCIFLYFFVHRLTLNRLVALSVTWLLAFSYYFWAVSLVAELYALQTLFAIVLLWLAWAWHTQGQPWQLHLFALLFGLSLGTHLSMVLLIPGFAILFLFSPPRFTFHASRLKPLLKALPFFLLGCAVYLYLPWRHLAETPMNYARDYWHINLASWDGFWWMVTGRMFESLFFGVPTEQLPTESVTYLHRLWGNFMGLGLVLAVVGFLVEWRKRPILNLSLLLMFLAHVAFFLTYRVADKDLMFLPAYLICAVWAGLGATFLAQQLHQRAPAEYHLLAPTLLLLLPLTSLLVNYRYADLSHDYSAREEGERIFAGIADEAIFLGSWRDVPILEYLQLVEGQRRDVTLINLVFVGQTAGQKTAVEKLMAGYAVYTSKTYLDNEALDLIYQDDCRCYQIVLQK